MTKRSIIAYWLLLFVPTLVIGGLGFRLLSREKARIFEQRRFLAVDRARAIAGTVHLAVIAVEDGVTETLKRMDRVSPGPALLRWRRENPLVRNVFIWRPDRGLILPDPKEPGTREERRFVARYLSLFNGTVPWESAATSPEIAPRPKAVQPGRKLFSGLRAPKVGQYAQVSLPQKGAERSGWMPWFSETRLFILGWHQAEPRGAIIGAELEMAAVLSRLMADLPRDASEGTVYAILDDGGQVMHQGGSGIIKNAAGPDVSVTLAPYLPHWQVAIYFTGEDGGQGAAEGFMLLSGLLLAIFLAAILLGGSLLLWQAHRNIRDARQKTTFVSNVSHELKTPLTSIRMYAELLSEGRVTDPEKRDRYIDVIVSESQRLTRLVNNVLDFSRLEQGRKEYHPAKMDAVQCVRDVLDAQRPRLQAAGMGLVEKLPREPVDIVMDRDALEQVLLNLIDNCVKYAADHGHDPEVSVTLTDHDGRWELRVSDTGPGIPEAHREKVFEKFHRVDDSLTAAKPGSGLGLSISRRLMRDLGGDITYEPEEGGGSCFVVRLPTGGRDE